MKYTAKLRNENNSPLYKKEYQEEMTAITGKKGTQRKLISESVGDIEDNHADTAKWLSLITTVIERIWSIMPEDAKANLESEEKSLIDYTLTQFKATDTRADVQFKTEGIAMVDKLMQRQKDIGEIVK